MASIAPNFNGIVPGLVGIVKLGAPGVGKVVNGFSVNLKSYGRFQLIALHWQDWSHVDPTNIELLLDGTETKNSSRAAAQK